jgi:hypothetical protein
MPLPEAVAAVVTATVAATATATATTVAPTESFVHLIDVSTSTERSMCSGTVFDEERGICLKIMKKNPEATHRVVAWSFEVNNPIAAERPVPVVICPFTGQVNCTLPPMSPNGNTYTAKALQWALDLNKKGTKITSVIIYTDGATDSFSGDLKRLGEELIKAGVTIKVIVVMTDNKNLAQLAQGLETSIVGFDLTQPSALGNLITSLDVYNAFHRESPFNALQSSRVPERTKLMFCSVPIPERVNVPRIITDVISSIASASAPSSIEPAEFTTLLIEVGRLVSGIKSGKGIPYETDTWIQEIVTGLCLIGDHLFSSCVNPSTQELFTSEEIRTLTKNTLDYAYGQVKKDEPIVLTGSMSARVSKESRKEGYAKGTADLTSLGPTLGQNDIMLIDISKGLIVGATSDTCPALKMHGSFPNACYELTSGGKFFVLPTSILYQNADLAQPVRQWLREVAKCYGFVNSMGPNVIFMITTLMTKMVLRGHKLTDPIMLKLQRLAIVQMSMLPPIGKGPRGETIYAADGFWAHWKRGVTISIHCTQSKEDHSSLYTDPLINPLQLPQLLWWALQMLMVDCFDEQLSSYNQALIMLDIEPTKEAFMTYIMTEYSKCVKGSAQVATLETIPQSFSSMSPHPTNVRLYKMLTHTNQVGGRCSTDTVVSDDERKWILEHQCPFCRGKVGIASFEDFQFKEAVAIFADVIAKSRSDPLCMTNTKVVSPLQLPSSIAPVALSVYNGMVYKCGPRVPGQEGIAFVTLGTTGSGKTSFLHVMREEAKKRGLKSITLSPDYLNTALASKSKQQKSQHYERLMSSKPPVVFVDYCCTQVEPASTYLNVGLSSYQIITVMPNVMVDRDGNKLALKEFQHWCLDHLLKRKPQSPVSTDDGSMVGHWLNPETVGDMFKFIGIHNDKVSALLGSAAILIPTHLSATQAKEYVTPGAIAYQKMLDDAGMTLEYQVKSIMDIAYPPLPVPVAPIIPSAGGGIAAVPIAPTITSAGGGIAAVPIAPTITSAGGGVAAVRSVPLVSTSNIPVKPNNMSNNRSKRWDKNVGLYNKTKERKFLDVLIEMAREETAQLASVAVVPSAPIAQDPSASVAVVPSVSIAQEVVAPTVPNPFTRLVSSAMAFIPKFS